MYEVYEGPGGYCGTIHTCVAKYATQFRLKIWGKNREEFS